MPKIIKPPDEKDKNILQSNINYRRNLIGMSEEQMCKGILSYGQYLELRKDPGKYRYDELLKIARRLKTTTDKLIIPTI